MSTLRRRAGLTQQRLADIISAAAGVEINLHTVSGWERGLRSIPAALVPEICRALHCTSWDLYPHSDTLTDRDVRLIATIRAMGDDEKADLYYLLHDWAGDRKALLKLDVIHAVQSKELRYVPDRMIIESYEDAVRRGGQGIDTRAKVDLDYVRKAFLHLLDDE